VRASPPNAPCLPSSPPPPARAKRWRAPFPQTPFPRADFFIFFWGKGAGHALAFRGCGRAPRAAQSDLTTPTVRLQPAGCPYNARPTTIRRRAGTRGQVFARAGGLSPCVLCRHAPSRLPSRGALTALSEGYRDVVPAQSARTAHVLANPLGIGTGAGLRFAPPVLSRQCLPAHWRACPSACGDCNYQPPFENPPNPLVLRGEIAVR